MHRTAHLSAKIVNNFHSVRSFTAVGLYVNSLPNYPDIVQAFLKICCRQGCEEKGRMQVAHKTSPKLEPQKFKYVVFTLKAYIFKV